MRILKKQFVILSIIFSLIINFFQENYVFAEENYFETQVNVTYQDKTNARGVSYQNALISIVKADGRKLTINCGNVCPYVVTDIKVEIVIAAWNTDHTKITSYSVRPIELGSLSPGTGTPVTYTIPAPLAYPIQAEVCISGNVMNQRAIGYGVVVFQ